MTLAECRELQQRIKKIEPACFANTAYEKAGLTKALCTTNPLWPPGWRFLAARDKIADDPH